MLLDERCESCFINTYNKLLLKHHATDDQRSVFDNYLQEVLSDSKNLTTPEVQRLLQHRLEALLGISDFYLREKWHSNEVALALYPLWKNKVEHAADPFDLALRLAIAGNIMDYGANHTFDIEETIQEVVSKPFEIDHSRHLKERLAKASSVLYLGDNAGEIVFDRLFLETIQHPNVTFVVRGGPTINDTTLDDAQMVGMEHVAKVISNGYDVPSTVPERSSALFQRLFADADLIISKGQGNLEGLFSLHDERIFFLLMTKCDVIARLIGAEKGNCVVFNEKYVKIRDQMNE
ncbi:MAG: damage-control phosphatase ARMT1 family protein [Microbacter sp.]